MAKNNLTPEQDLLCRRFYIEVAEKAEALLPDTPVHAQRLRRTILMLLNYRQLPNGAFVQADKAISRSFGNPDYSAYTCEWADDAQRAWEALALEDEQEYTDEPEDEEDWGTIAKDVESASETSGSVEAEDTEVRETILPEDV